MIQIAGNLNCTPPNRSVDGSYAWELDGPGIAGAHGVAVTDGGVYLAQPSMRRLPWIAIERA